MATVHIKTGATGIEFGIPAEEGGLITQKVTMNYKSKKKDLRGRQGGYKAIASYGNELEVSIDGATPTAGTLASTGFTLGDTHTPDVLNDVFALGIDLYVESITLNQKNDDFTKASIKLVGSEYLSA